MSQWTCGQTSIGLCVAAQAEATRTLVDETATAERHARRLAGSLMEVLEQINTITGYELTRDTETYKAEAVIDMDKALGMSAVERISYERQD